LRQFLRSAPAGATALTISRAHYQLGRIAEGRGDKKAARAEYIVALQDNPRSQVIRRALDHVQ
jgi:TolA-binding protein